MSKRNPWFWVSKCLALVTLLGVPETAAQQAPPQGMPGILLEQQRQSEEKEKQQEQITAPPAPAQIDKPARVRPPRGSEAAVQLNKIKFSGNNVIATNELEEVVAPAIGKVLTLSELQELANEVSEYYAAYGYLLAKVYLPPQEIKEGVVEMAVLEGEIGTIEVTGNTRYKSSTILRAMELVKRRKVVHEGTLETALNELNSYPGLRVRADLKPGTAPGSSDIHLTAKERMPYAFTADINNYGSRLIGPWVYSGELGIGNILGLGDNLTLKGSKSDDNLFLTNVGYLIPVTSFGTKLQFSWIHSENVIGAEFASQRPVGRADIASIDLLQTIIKTGNFSLVVNGGFDFKTIRNIIAVPGPSGILQSKDELRVFSLGLRGDYRDQFLGRTYFSLTWHHGVDFWGGSEQNAPQTSFVIVDPVTGIGNGAGPGSWSKATVDVARFQSLSLPFFHGLPILPNILQDSYMILRASGQIASDRLLAPERFSIGGFYTVRGYPIAERIGDHGYVATAEMVVPVPSSANIPFTSRTWKETFQVAAFIDHAGVYVSRFTQPTGVSGPQPQDYLTGAGGGLRISLPFGVPQPVDRGVLSLKIDWATAIGRPRPSSRDQGISLNDVYGDGAAGVLYVSAALRF